MVKTDGGKAVSPGPSLSVKLYHRFYLIVRVLEGLIQSNLPWNCSISTV